MLIRITRPRAGDLEGVDLGSFVVDAVYDVPAPLATYLVVTQSAELVDADPHEPAGARSEKRMFRGVWPPFSVAAEKGRRRKRKSPRRR